MLLLIRKLNDSIVKQEKANAKKNLQDLIQMLNSMTLDFFNILKQKEAIDQQLTDKYSLTAEETLKVFETNEAEMKFLKDEITNNAALFDFNF